jgi:hypothetical protein
MALLLSGNVKRPLLTVHANASSRLKGFDFKAIKIVVQSGPGRPRMCAICQMHVNINPAPAWKPAPARGGSLDGYPALVTQLTLHENVGD